jgi:uncharacterized membrane protein YphA (DoxX/SURF4 family)
MYMNDRLNSLNNPSFAKASSIILRLGIGFVFTWFGWSGITNTEQWVGLVPAWTSAFGSPELLVKIHGVVEFVFGILLILGVYTRIAATILFLSLFNTLFAVQGPTLIRDIGLATATLSLALRPRQIEAGSVPRM